MEAQKRQQELVLRRKNEEVRHTKSHWHHNNIRLCFTETWKMNALFHDLCQVTALRRQVRPVSGKVSRKVSLPEPLQEPSHRATPARMHTYGVASSNGARYGIWVCVKVIVTQLCFNNSKRAMSCSSGVPQWGWEVPTSAGQPGPSGSRWRDVSVTSSCRGWPSRTWSRIWTDCWRYTHHVSRFKMAVGKTKQEEKKLCFSGTK